MAEFRKLPTQAELQQMLFMESMRTKTPQEIAQENLAKGTTIKPIPENVFQKMAGGARTAGEFVNRAGTAADVAKLFPGYTGQSTVNIPTSFNFAPKQAPTGEVIPGGLQTQPVQVNQLLKAIKPADVLGISGAERAYTDVGLGKAPQPLDVLDVAGLGAIGYGAGKTALKATKGVPVGLSIQETKGLLETAPKSDIGFYSAVEQAALATPRKSGTGQAFLNDISKGQDVRADEIKWMGLDDFLKGKQNVTRQEVQDYIANNRVDVQEVKSTIPRLPGEEMPGDEGAFLPNFAQWQLPGGENYRELLLTMPTNISRYNKYAASLRAKYGEGGFSNLPLTDIERSRLDKFYESEDLPFYESSHFPGQPNILAHLRVNDRVDADGKKMLLIEEVQSDWHQAGRDRGYKTKQNLENWYNQNKLDTDPPFASLNSEQISTIERNRNAGMGGDTGVPDAPMKDTWYQLALKRAIQHAAENGYDRIGLTTGARQASRFDLSKQVERIISTKDGDGFRIFARDTNGKNHDMGVFTKDGLSDVVGKDLAKKIESQGKDTEVFEGVDLKVGGEGMKKYYDEIYPKFLDKYGKKWGARVGETSVETDKNAKSWAYFRDWFNENHSDVGGSSTALSQWERGESSKYVREFLKDIKTQEPIRYIDITPEMKAGVSKGQPLFMAAPIGAGLLGSESMTPER